MKNSTYLIILLALGLVLVSYKWLTAAPEPKNETTMNATIEDIMTRTSVRSYTSEPVTDEQLDTLLRAAMAAPTAGNKQPWRMVVVNDRAELDTIASTFPTMRMAAHAPLAVIMCGVPSETFDGEGVDYWKQDVSAASENLLLAAHAIGLGAVWCGIYPITDRVEKFSKLLNLPDTIVPMACVCIGHPDGQSKPKDKWKPERVQYNTWK